MRAYKHVKIKHADDFDNGLGFSVGTFDYYRNWDDPRGDPLEGKVVVTQPPGQNMANRPDLWAEVGLPQRPRMGPLSDDEENRIVMYNTFSFTMPLAYIFCCSASPDYDRVETHGEAIFEIFDLSVLATRIARANRGLLGSSAARPVEYVPRMGYVGSGPLRPSPFKKNPDFEWENELRVVWETVSVPKPQMILSAPRAASLVKRIAG